MTKSAHWGFAHNDDPIPDAGGIFSDSAAGTQSARRHASEWIDQDGQLMPRTHAQVKLGAEATDLVWVNAHGAPWLPAYMHGKRFAHTPFDSIDSAEHGLRTAAETFAQNAAAGLGTEWEVKWLAPFTTRAALRRAMRSLRQDAKAAYGPRWRKRVIVKVLDTLPGGLEYALLVLQVAHRHRFTTMLLNHSGKTVVIGPARARYIDFVRGPWRRRLTQKIHGAGASNSIGD